MFHKSASLSHLIELIRDPFEGAILEPEELEDAISDDAHLRPGWHS